jgi:hypothetical protein
MDLVSDCLLAISWQEQATVWREYDEDICFVLDQLPKLLF